MTGPVELPSPTPEQPLTEISPRDWISALYTGAMPPNGWVEFRLLKDGVPSKYWMSWPLFKGHPDAKTLDDVRRWVAKGQNVYYGVSLRKEEGVSGDKEVHPTHLLWQDLDLKDAPEFMPEGQDVKQMTPDALKVAKVALFAEVMRRCEVWTMPPAAVVDSGHGLHVTWKRTARSDTKETEDLNLMLWELFKGLCCLNRNGIG